MKALQLSKYQRKKTCAKALTDLEQLVGVKLVEPLLPNPWT